MRGRPRRTRLASLAAVSVLAGGSHRVLAEPYKAKLSVQRAPEASACEDAALLSARINRIAGRDAISNGGATVDLALTIERRARVFHAHLAAYGATQGERDLEDDGPTCRGLDEAVAVSVALLLDEAPEKTREPSPPSTQPSSGVGGADSPDEPPPPPPKPREPPPETTVEVFTLGTAGMVGRTTLGTELGFTMRLRPLLTVGAGIFGLIQDEERFGSGGLWLNLVGVRAPVCLSLRTKDRATGGGFCGFPALGVLHASGHGFEENDTASEPWFAMGASGVVFGPLSGPIGLIGRVDLIVPVVRPHFVVKNLGAAPVGESGVAYQTPPVGFCAAVGIRTLLR